MKTYQVTDGYGAEIEIQAQSSLDACQEYVESGDYAGGKTVWVSVRATRLTRGGKLTDNTDCHTITVPANEPGCSESEHDWQSPIEVVGGIKENPGVWGHGGGVIITKVCQHCGCYRITDTWAQNPENGEQGLRSVEYRDADEQSKAWVAAQEATI